MPQVYLRKGGAQAHARPRAKGQPLEAVQRSASLAQEPAGAGGVRARRRERGTWQQPGQCARN